jgi:hypothetical protein
MFLGRESYTTFEIKGVRLFKIQEEVNERSPDDKWWNYIH